MSPLIIATWWSRIDLRFFKLWIMLDPKVKVWNIKGLRHQVARMDWLQKKRWWSLHNYFVRYFQSKTHILCCFLKGFTVFPVKFEKQVAQQENFITNVWLATFMDCYYDWIDSTIFNLSLSSMTGCLGGAMIKNVWLVSYWYLVYLWWLCCLPDWWKFCEIFLTFLR